MKSLLENTGQRKQCDHHSLLLGGIRVRVSQKLSAVAFWSWNLDVVVFQSWNLDVVAFRPLKKCLGITMSWVSVFRCRGFLALESQCRGFLILESRCRGICVSTVSFLLSLNL